MVEATLVLVDKQLRSQNGTTELEVASWSAGHRAKHCIPLFSLRSHCCFQMRAIAAFALARLASASSVSSTLAAYQKFADEMIAKYGQAPTAVAEASDDTTDTTVTMVSDDKGNTVEDAAQVSKSGGSGIADSGDTETIKQVIGWLEALYTDSLKVDHESDVDLMLKCQERIDACEDPATDYSDPEVSHDFELHPGKSKVLYKRIGSMCQAPSTAWTKTKPTFEDTAATAPLPANDKISGTVETPGFQLPNAVDPAGGDPDPMFNFLTPNPWTKAKSLWAKMHNQCNRHKQCRINHQHVECLTQKDECGTYDNTRDLVENQFPTCARKPATATCFPEPLTGGEQDVNSQSGTAVQEKCMQVKDALSDEFIQQEWWFVESHTVENCLDQVAQWFVGCSLSTGAQMASETGSCVNNGNGIWWRYQDCDLALKKCAEATLTCDDIQHEFEAAACDWTHERLRSCDKHYTCYDTEIEACAKNCRIIQHRVVGRKAEFEIIQRITCMLNALLANNEQHRTGVADSGDEGNKTTRLAACKKMGDYNVNNQYQLTDGLDLLNITCQGPKKKTAKLTKFSTADPKPANFEATLPEESSPHKWMIDLNGGLAGDNVEEHDTNIESHWRPGWRKDDYLDWAAEYPRGSQEDVVTGCGEDSVLKVGGTGPCSTLSTPENLVTIEMEEEDPVNYAASTVERFSFTEGHLYDSKTGVDADAAAVTIKADGTKATQATRSMVHRKPKEYQKWGYGCSTGYRPCTSSFIRESYGFLSDQSHFLDDDGNQASSIQAARAPCTKCDGEYKPAGSSSEDTPDDDDPCNWGTQMSHKNDNKDDRFDSGNSGFDYTETGAYGQVGDQARNLAVKQGRKSGLDFATCECFHSRDPNFCATDLQSTAKTCNGGGAATTGTGALAGSYCHNDHRNTDWDR